MTQIKHRLPESASLSFRLDPIGELVGYAAVCDEIPEKRPAARYPQDAARTALVPSCAFQRSAPTSTAPDAGPGGARPGEDATGPHAPEQPASWLARLWSRYIAWREHRRTAAAWETLDARTLRDIGASEDEVDPDIRRSAAYWGWYTTL
jgi:uncharacterized protein YjiS (DUF1127 family)